MDPTRIADPAIAAGRRPQIGVCGEVGLAVASRRFEIGGSFMQSSVRFAVAGALVVVVAGFAPGVAGAQERAVDPPQGARLVLEALADGVQIYACEAKDQGFAWVFKSPEATLFDRDGRQIGMHFAGPTWKTTDGAAVVGELAARADAPVKDAIPWLLLRAKSHEGSGPLADVAFIRRFETKGGAAPHTPCDAPHLSEQARMRYSSTYQFFAAAN
jgi:hypothetical protein